MFVYHNPSLRLADIASGWAVVDNYKIELISFIFVDCIGRDCCTLWSCNVGDVLDTVLPTKCTSTLFSCIWFVHGELLEGKQIPPSPSESKWNWSGQVHVFGMSKPEEIFRSVLNCSSTWTNRIAKTSNLTLIHNHCFGFIWANDMHHELQRANCGSKSNGLIQLRV